MSSQKDFDKAIKIANIIGPACCGVHKLDVINAFVDLFRDNPKFDETEFRNACWKKGKV
jgi:hypothetical protein